MRSLDRKNKSISFETVRNVHSHRNVLPLVSIVSFHALKAVILMLLSTGSALFLNPFSSLFTETDLIFILIMHQQ